jgi:hypothetical protein
MATDIPIPFESPPNLEAAQAQVLIPEMENTNPNWASSRIGSTVAGVIVALELAPPTNEGSRIAIGAVVQAAFHDPVLSALAIGVSSLIIEGGGAIVNADLMDAKMGNAFNKARDRASEWRLLKNIKTNLPIEAGVAVTVGTPAAQWARAYSRGELSRQDNRRWGVLMSLGTSAYLGALSYEIFEGVSHPSPDNIGLAALAIGVGVGTIKWAKGKVKGAVESAKPEDNEIGSRSSNRKELLKELQFREVSFHPADEESIEGSVSFYRSLTKDSELPQHLGLVGDDIFESLRGPDVLKISYTDKSGNTLYLPLLVPIKNLSWYNKDYFEANFGKKNIYYFGHSIEDSTEDDPRIAAIGDVINDGSIVIFDSLRTNTGIVIDSLADLFGDIPQGIVVKELEGADGPSFLNQYEGVIIFNGDLEPKFVRSKSVFETYKDSVESGIFKDIELSGIGMVDVIEGDEAERFWDIYRAPFKRIGSKHPIDAGFDHDSFIDLLQDPNVIKCVHRSDGLITALSLYVTDLDKCPWLNKEYYADSYKDAYETNNLFISLGIVGNESVRTSKKSMQMSRFVMRLLSERKSSIVFAFECNDVSATYIPKIVSFGINHSGKELSRVSGISGSSDFRSQLNFSYIASEEA